MQYISDLIQLIAIPITISIRTMAYKLDLLLRLLG